MVEMGKYCKAYMVRDLRRYPGWRENLDNIRHEREVVDGQIPPGAVLMGDGVQRHRAILESLGNPILPEGAGLPDAGGLLRGLAMTPDAAPVRDVGRWNPDYLRVSGAERLWKVPGR